MLLQFPSSILFIFIFYFWNFQVFKDSQITKPILNKLSPCSFSSFAFESLLLIFQGCLVAPTLSIGSILLQQAAISASFHYNNVEIVESRPTSAVNSTHWLLQFIIALIRSLLIQICPVCSQTIIWKHECLHIVTFFYSCLCLFNTSTR